MNGIYARYYEQKNCIDVVVYEAGYVLRLDCSKWEDGIKTTLNSQGSLDALAIDDPLEYVRLHWIRKCRCGRMLWIMIVFGSSKIKKLILY